MTWVRIPFELSMEIPWASIYLFVKSKTTLGNCFRFRKKSKLPNCNTTCPTLCLQELMLHKELNLSCWLQLHWCKVRLLVRVETCYLDTVWCQWTFQLPKVSMVQSFKSALKFFNSIRRPFGPRFSPWTGSTNRSCPPILQVKTICLPVQRTE